MMKKEYKQIRSWIKECCIMLGQIDVADGIKFSQRFNPWIDEKEKRTVIASADPVDCVIYIPSGGSFKIFSQKK